MPEVLIEYAATAWKAMMASSDPLPSLPNDLVRSISVLPSYIVNRGAQNRGEPPRIGNPSVPSAWRVAPPVQ